MEVCVTNLIDEATNMAIMRVNMPTGFFMPSDANINSTSVRKIEVDNQETLATLYFDAITNQALCTSIMLFRRSIVDDVKDGSIVVNDYYDTCELFSRIGISGFL
jgi:hypothetical protein